MSELAERTGVLGADPLDSRAAADLPATPVPGLLLVIGLVLGPEGVNVLSRSVLEYLDPAVSTALAALGLLFGLGFDGRNALDRRLLGVASLEAAVTAALVAAGFFELVQPHAGGTLLFVALVAICAAGSSTSPARENEAPLGARARLADLDNLLPILLGGVALAAAREGTLGGGLWFTLQGAAVAVAVACAGWLLLGRSSPEGGQHVFTAGVVLLLGGLADFLGSSALLNGLVAGMVLGALGGSARAKLARDVGHVQHPLAVLLLLVAGARAGLAHGVLVPAVAYVALRFVGKLGAALLLRRAVAARRDRGELAALLVSPGMLAPAFALNCGLAGADPEGRLLSLALAGSVISELLALLLRRRDPS